MAFTDDKKKRKKKGMNAAELQIIIRVKRVVVQTAHMPELQIEHNKNCRDVTKTSEQNIDHAV